MIDSILTLVKGELKCEGSPTFLKNNLGQGYHLNLSLLKDYDLEKLTNFVKSYVPDASLKDSYGSEAR